ncbi:WSC and peroxidase domain protein [Metarhizium robertsii]|uniref:Copper radical oxidase n=2 Tax=Metarhizium robertsii TaxID=568076 RepID=E9F4T5_METRA|nr:copper radical oxidase [Metarhizium robertsii ARSEF 23]EFY97267.1 copper radical oxidase [Metarhizium robertsii ARSEF 23]EXV00739.1 WSC and peroxidase domain protein [Metarhizium robertsii]
MKTSPVLLGLLSLAGSALADPTWPSSIDELEEIMYQINSFRARKFADTVNPCTNEASGPGRRNAAEWLRSAFHDMSTANTFFKTGGLDGSLQYELDNGENTGPGHRTTMNFMGPYVTRRSSLSDLLAMGVYMSVRSCGGPIIPIRAGRIDATAAGALGVPQPQNSATMFQQQFERMGFSTEEMIQATACGHTLGGVHQDEFPDLMPATGVVSGNVALDSTDAVFDNKVVTEYLSGNTTNMLVVGPSVRINKNSDFKVFNVDGNKTMETLTDANNFKAVCQKVLQKMIEVVPPTVTLTDPIVPYTVKPVNLQLTLTNGGTGLQFTGFIRVKVTDLAKDSIKNVAITYKDRKGNANCGASACTITSTVQGVAQGFDDNFNFYPIEAVIPAASGISSFTVTVNNADGTSKAYDNNGNGYPLQDDILFQAPQSCVTGSSGALTVVAAVRNDVASNGAQASITYKTPQTNSPVALLNNATVPLQKGACLGKYTLFSGQYTIPGGMPYQSRVDVISGSKADTFKAITDIGGTCTAFPNPGACDAVDPPVNSTTTTTTPGSTATTTTTTSIVAPVTPTHRATVAGYTHVSCWSEGVGVRALAGTSFANDTMTLEKCADYCKAYVYWGTEYGRECYCGNALDKTSAAAALTECNMACGGDPSAYCGAGNRLELYSTTSAPVTPTPTATLSHKPTVAPYTMVGCWSEGNGVRALGQAATTSDKMTNEACATFCKSFKYFGTEYGSECYCGSFLADSSKTAPIGECNMPCSGDQYEYCGASSRLELYQNPNITTGNPEQPAAVGDYVFAGCQTEGNNTRALDGPTLPQNNMTNEVCATFCNSNGNNFTYFGTEYGRECYCGNALAASSAVAPAADCRMLCGGSDTEYCGASNRLSVYKKKQIPATTQKRRRNYL